MLERKVPSLREAGLTAWAPKQMRRSASAPASLAAEAAAPVVAPAAAAPVAAAPVAAPAPVAAAAPLAAAPIVAPAPVAAAVVALRTFMPYACCTCFAVRLVSAPEAAAWQCVAWPALHAGWMPSARYPCRHQPSRSLLPARSTTHGGGSSSNE